MLLLFLSLAHRLCQDRTRVIVCFLVRSSQKVKATSHVLSKLVRAVFRKGNTVISLLQTRKQKLEKCKSKPYTLSPSGM